MESIRTYRHSITITTPALGQDLVKTMGGAWICLMRGHGIIAAGPSIEHASLDAVHLNELAMMNYRAHLLGNPAPISAGDQAAFRNMAMARGRADRAMNARRIMSIRPGAIIAR